jgi:hypothetical protein
MNNPMIPLTQFSPRPLHWLWPGRLAVGKLAMFDGDPGRGKSLITLDLCARITTGRAMPDGTGAAPSANVIIIQGEDFPDDTVLPRLQGLGADIARVMVFRRNLFVKRRPFSLPSGAKLLDRALAMNRPRLLVVDPIMAFLDRDVQSSSDQGVRRALSCLALSADKYACACVLVRHMNKRGTGRSIYRGGGSIAFNAACRSSWLFDADPADPARQIMAQIKNNLAPPQQSLAYRIHNAPGAQPTLEWLGPVSVSADDLLARAGRKPPKPLAFDRACEFLPALLDNGPLPTQQIWQAARAQGLQRRTVQSAREFLGIRFTRVWNGRQQLTYWLLDHQKLPDSIPADQRSDDLDDLFAVVREKYPLDPLEDPE